MDQRRNNNSFRYRGTSPHNRWRGGNSNQYYPNQQGRKFYRRNDYENDRQYGEYSNNRFQYNQQNQQSRSLSDFLLGQSKLVKDPGTPYTDSSWSDEAQEEARKKEINDAASKLINKIKGGDQDDRSCKSESENSDFPSEESSHVDEPPKRIAHVRKPFLPAPPVQPEVRRKSNEQRERPHEDSSNKTNTAQRNIQRNVIGELLNMPEDSLRMVLNNPKMNPKIEMGMSNLVKETRLLLSQNFRRMAESKMRPNEHFIREPENMIDADQVVDLGMFPPEIIKQIGEMFQLNFDTGLEQTVDNSFIGYPSPTENSFNFYGNSSEKLFNESSEVNNSLSNNMNNLNNSFQFHPPEKPDDNQPKWAKYLKKKTEEVKVESIPLPEGDNMESVSIPLLSDLPEEKFCSPVKSSTQSSIAMSPSPQKQISNVDEFDIYPWKDRNVMLSSSVAMKKETPISPVSKASSKHIASPEENISSNNEWSGVEEDFLSLKDKDKNQNIKSAPLPLSVKIKNMQELQAERLKSMTEVQSKSKSKKDRSMKCKNFIEKLEIKNNNTRDLVDKKSGDDSPMPSRMSSQSVQVDIKKIEPVTFKSFENNLLDLIKSNKDIETLKRILNFHVINLHGECKKPVETEIRYAQTEIKEFETNFTQTEKSPEKVYRRTSVQTDAQVKTVKKPAGTQTILKSSEVSNIYGVPIPILPAEESNENLLNEVKMIDKVLHKLNERKFNIFLKLSNFNFLNDGETSNSFLHTVTNGDMNIWKHIFTKDSSTERKSSSYSHKKPSRDRSHSDNKHKEKSSSSHNRPEQKKEEKTQRRRTPPPQRHRSPAQRHRSPPAQRHHSPPAQRHHSPPAQRHQSPPAQRHRSPPSQRNRSPPAQRARTPPRNVTPTPQQQQQQQHHASPKPYKTKAELKSITSLSQLKTPLEETVMKDETFVKKWVESQDPTKYEEKAESDTESKSRSYPKARSEKDKKSERSDRKSEKKQKVKPKKTEETVATGERPVIHELVQNAIEALEIDLMKETEPQKPEEMEEPSRLKKKSSVEIEVQSEPKQETEETVIETPSETKEPAKKKKRRVKKVEANDSKPEDSAGPAKAKKRKRKIPPEGEETSSQPAKVVKKKKAPPPTVEGPEDPEAPKKPTKKRFRRLQTVSSTETDAVQNPKPRRKTNSTEDSICDVDMSVFTNRMKNCSVRIERLNLPVNDVVVDNDNNSDNDNDNSNDIPSENNDESALIETKAEGDCDNINKNFDEDLPPDPGNQSPVRKDQPEEPENQPSLEEERPAEDKRPEVEERPEIEVLPAEEERLAEVPPEPMEVSIEEIMEINPQSVSHNSVPLSTATETSDDEQGMDLDNNTVSSDTKVPTVNESEGKKEIIFDSSVSDHSIQFLTVQNGDALSRNSESIQGSGSKKRKVSPISFSCHKGVILEVKIIGKHIFAACEDKLVYCYSIKSGKRKKEYSGHTDAVTSIAFLTGKKDYTEGLLFTGSLDSHVRSFVIKTSTLSKQSQTLPSQVQCLEENWGIVYAGLKNGLIMRFNSKTLKAINPPLEASQQSVLALKTLMEGPRKIVIVATRSNSIAIRDGTTGLLLRSIDLNFTGNVYSLTFNSNQIYCGTSEPKLFSFDFTDGTITGEYECGPGVLSIKLVQNLIFASSYDGKIYVIDSKTKERVGVIPGPGKMLTAMDIYKNRQIVASSNDKKLETWVIPAYIRNLLKRVPNAV